MTLKIRIEVPKDAGPYEAQVMHGTNEHVLAPGDVLEVHVWSLQDVHITEVPAGTKAAKGQA